MSGCAGSVAAERPPSETAGTDVVDVPDGTDPAGAGGGSSGSAGSTTPGTGGGVVGAGGGGSAGSVVVTPGGDAGPVVQLKGLHVNGNRIFNGANQSVQLRGVNRSGTEYGCIRGTGIFDGPDDDASINAMASWKINAVRIPLNETCWLGINGVNAAYSGQTYQKAITDYVGRLLQHQLIPILELHWSAPTTWQADRQQAMPDRDHSIDFWKQVASAFAANDTVIFDPFNEPFPDSNSDSDEAWRCWRDGGTCVGFSFQAAGMQELVTADSIHRRQEPHLVGRCALRQRVHRLAQPQADRSARQPGRLVARLQLHSLQRRYLLERTDGHARPERSGGRRRDRTGRLW